MADRGGELSFLWGIHVRINIRSEISISVIPMTLRFGKQVRLEDSTQMKLTKQLLTTSSRQDLVTN